VQFEREVKIKKPRALKQTDNQPEGPTGNIRQAKVLRLIFFLVTCATLLWLGKYSLEAAYCCITGCGYHKNMTQIYQEYKAYEAGKIYRRGQ
jgi:hypothetical protein